MTDRRQFLRGCAGTMLGAGLSAFGAKSPVQAAESATGQEHSPIVDTHQHLWDLKVLNLPWTSGRAALSRSFLMSDYLEATKGLNVVKAVYMEVAADPSQHVREAEYVIDLCRRDDNPTVAAVISGRPGEPGFEKYIRQFAGSPYIKGIRQCLHAGGCAARLLSRPGVRP